MALVDITDVCDRIWFWINKDPIVPDKIAAAYHQKGGWEGWAQVEIAYRVQEHYANITIDREVNVYAGTQKENDFVIKDKVNPAKPKQIVELKCERGTQNGKQFAASFVGDVNKINNYAINAAYRPAKAYAVGISCTPAGYTEVAALTLAGGVKPIGLQCGTTGIWIWYYVKDIF